MLLLVTFIALQILDALTTAVFLNMGVAEANPLIRFTLAHTGHHAASTALALAGPKLFAIALALLAWRSGRHGLLLKMDILFSLCVAWNLLAIFSRI